MFGKKIFFLGSLILFTASVGLATVYAMPVAPKRFARQVANVTGGSPVGSVFTVSGQDLEEKNPAIAYNPDRQEYLAVWYNDRAGNDDIQAQRFSKDGKPIEGAFGFQPERAQTGVTPMLATTATQKNIWWSGSMKKAANTIFTPKLCTATAA